MGDGEEWISLREGARRLGIDKMSFYRVIDAGVIRCRQIPGLQPRYSARDVQAVADRAVTLKSRDASGRTQ
jgi:hypothetical protein